MKRAQLVARIGTAALAMAAVLALAPVPATAQKFVMKFGTATPRGDQNHWMEVFKQRVEARAGGRIDIKLFPASQLGAIPREIEGLQLGTVEAWIGPVSFVTGVEPRYQILDAPGVFADWAHAQRTVTDPDFRDWYLALGEAKGIKGIGIYVSNPMAVVSRKRAIRKVEDFRGLKLRVLGSKMEVEIMRRLGAAGVPMPLVSVLPAVQRGTIDGVRSGIVVFVPFKYWTVSKIMTETADTMIIPVAYVSMVWWKKLPHDLQQIMLEEGRKLDDENYRYTLRQHKLFRSIWKKNGGEIIDMKGAERERMMRLVRPAGEAVVRANPELKKAYDRLIAVAKKTAK